MTLDERAQNARKQLFERYDQLNALWQKAEEQLTKYHIPRPVFHNYDNMVEGADGQMYPDGFRCLALDKVDGKWRIVWGCYPDEHPELGDWKPITECSAEIRVEATGHYPALRLAVIESAEAFIAEVELASDLLAEAIEKEPRLVEAK